MPHVDDLSRSLTAFDQDSTLVAVIEMSLKSGVVARIRRGLAFGQEEAVEGGS